MGYRTRLMLLTWALATTLSLLAQPGLALEAGQRAPQFAVESLVGDKNLSLSAYRGKVVYLDFWASWCAPCLVALPELEKLRKEFPATQFQVLSVNLDRDLDKARRFLRDHDVNYPSGSDPEGSIADSYGLDTMPSSYLIDSKGVIRYVHRGFRASDIDEIRQHIRRLLRR